MRRGRGGSTRLRLVLVVVVAAGAVSTGPASGQVAPSLESSIADVDVFWDDAPAYPSAVVYDGRLSTVAEYSSAFAQDTTSPTRFVRLAELGAPPDTITTWRLSGRAIPVRARLLNDAGVNFHVLGVEPFGTTVYPARGAVHDMYFWGGAPRGAQAVQGNVSEMFVLNDTAPVLFPGRNPSQSEGGLVWDRAPATRTPTSRAYDPSGTTVDRTELVAAIDSPSLRVEGGDLTQPADAAPITLGLPEDVSIQGGLAIYPTGLPGVGIDLEMARPGGVGDPSLRFSVGVDPNEPWPQSRSAGPYREWMWRPVFVNYGVRASSGAPAVTSFEAPLPAGSAALAMAGDGLVRRIPARAQPRMLRVSNVDGRQTIDVVALGPQRASHPAESAPASDGSEIGSPEVRGALAAGAVRASLVERDGVMVVDDLVVGDHSYGDLALPALRIDGSAVKLTRADLIAPPQVVPEAFGNGPNTFYGSGFVLQLLAQKNGVMAELAVVPLQTSFSAATALHVVDVHSVDGRPHSVDADWYWKPAADRFTANDAEVPKEIVFHPEFNGGFGEPNVPDVEALDAASGKDIRFFHLAPILIWQGDPDGATNLVALVRDRGSFAADPIAQVDGEDLRGEVALYSRHHIEGFDDTGLGVRTWSILVP